MLGRGKLKVALVTIALLAALSGVAALPAASASNCTVTVTLITGQTLYFQLPQGAPLSSLNLSEPVKGMSESCGGPPPAAPITPNTTPTPTTSAPAPTTTHPSTTTSTSPGTGPPKSKGPGQAQPPSHHGGTSTGPAPKTTTPAKPNTPGKPSTTPAPPAPKPAPPIGQGGVPTPSNPTFSYALPGPAPVGVPNFFIDSFQIPPFLLPIYQAAGIQYDVPWQILAAINEIETDYGRNLSVSSAGAVGWMQFMPATWKTYGVDANGDGVADPYNPVDAIFTAARYLHAAGASKNLSGAIFSYNHATWYVQSVLLRAQLISGLPSGLVDSLTGLVEGYFPVAAPAKYADNDVTKLAKQKVKGSNAAVDINSDPNANAVHIFAKQNSPVIAVNDGKIVDLGDTPQLGKYIELQDSSGNVYTYAHLGSIPNLYPVPKPQQVTAGEVAQELSVPSTPAPKAPATAGSQGGQAPATAIAAAKPASTLKASASPITLAVAPAPEPVAQTQSQTQTTSIAQPMVKERLFANPRVRPPTPRAERSSSRTAGRSSRTSRTTSPTCCTWPRTSTRCSRCARARSWWPARSSAALPPGRPPWPHTPTS